MAARAIRINTTPTVVPYMPSVNLLETASFVGFRKPASRQSPRAYRTCVVHRSLKLSKRVKARYRVDVQGRRQFIIHAEFSLNGRLTVPCRRHWNENSSTSMPARLPEDSGLFEKRRPVGKMKAGRRRGGSQAPKAARALLAVVKWQHRRYGSESRWKTSTTKIATLAAYTGGSDPPHAVLSLVDGAIWGNRGRHSKFSERRTRPVRPAAHRCRYGRPAIAVGDHQ